MKIDKKKIFEKLLAITISAIFLFGLYIADIVSLSLFTWSPSYDFVPILMPSYGATRDGAQAYMILLISCPLFLISGLLMGVCGKWSGFSIASRSALLISLPLMFLGLINNVVEFIILLSVSFLTLYLFICDIFEVKTRLWNKPRKKLYFIIALLIMLSSSGIYFFKDNLEYYFKYNIAWNSYFSNLTEKEKEQLVVSIFEDKNFNTAKAESGLTILFGVCYSLSPSDSQEMQLIRRLVRVSGNDMMKLSVLKANLSEKCYGDVIDFANLAVNWADAEPVIKAFYQQDKTAGVPIKFILKQYAETAQIPRIEKLAFLWMLIHDYRHYMGYSYPQEYLFSILSQHFFELLQPPEYQENIKQYLA